MKLLSLLDISHKSCFELELFVHTLNVIISGYPTGFYAAI